MKLFKNSLVILTISLIGFLGDQSKAQEIREEEMIKDFLQKTELIVFPFNSYKVYETVANEIRDNFCKQAKFADREKITSLKKRIIELLISKRLPDLASTDKNRTFVKLVSEDHLLLAASYPSHLYMIWKKISEDWQEETVDKFKDGYYRETLFKRLDDEWDDFLIDDARTNRNFDMESHIQQIARVGFTHVEVNGLATALPYEQGSSRTGESYACYYSHAPDLEQFVETELTQGIFPAEYLQANLNRLKKIAELAEKYGLSPGFGAFSPRSMPEIFFDRYPMLRGPRVDHPFRSYKPRYSMTLGHPAVREHYKKMLQKLMKEVPSLDYYNIRPNDSGAGFEYTLSLYPGANGGPYLVREWKSLKEIHKAAGENIVRYYKLLRDAGQEINPNFRVITDLTHFDEERPYITQAMENNIDVIFSLETAKKEKVFIDALHNRKCDVHVPAGFGPGKFPPLLGIPHPWYLYNHFKKIKLAGFDNIIHTGGINPPSLVPHSINEEVLREYQLNPDVDIDEVVKDRATLWVGEKAAPKLIEAWSLVDKAAQSFKGISLYSYFAFVWFKTWVRPLVPNIEKMSPKERAYYEKYVVTIYNNPNRVDLERDCLWTLDRKETKRMKNNVDNNILPLIEKALTELNDVLREEEELSSKARDFIIDQKDRITALKCWMGNQCNVAAWVISVHGYLEAKEKKEKQKYRKMVREMVESQIKNTEELLNLWNTSTTEFMEVSEFGETTFIYAGDFGDLLEKKLALLRKHRNDEPYIDPNFMWRLLEYEHQY